MIEISICTCTMASNMNLPVYRYQLPSLGEHCSAYCGDGDESPIPPPPPLPTGYSYMHRVASIFIIQGDATSFDVMMFRGALLAIFQPAIEVSIRVTSGSINVQAELDFLNASAAEKAAVEISTTPVSNMQSSWFSSLNSIVIENRPVAGVTSVIIEDNSSSTTESPDVANNLGVQESVNEGSEHITVLAISLPLIVAGLIILVLWQRKRCSTFFQIKPRLTEVELERAPPHDIHGVDAAWECNVDEENRVVTALQVARCATAESIASSQMNVNNSSNQHQVDASNDKRPSISLGEISDQESGSEQHPKSPLLELARALVI